MSDAISKVPSSPWPPPGAGVPDEDAPALARPLGQRRLRLWPGVVVIALLWPALLGPRWLGLDPMIGFIAMFFAPMVATGAVVLWWLLASRLPWVDRVLVLAAFAAAAAATFFVYHSTVWADGYGLVMYALPAAATVWVGWLLLTPFLSWSVRRAGLLIGFVLAFGYFTLLRVDGVDGSMNVEKNWRWSPTAVQKFQAEKASRTQQAVASADGKKLALQPGDWPGFRGPERDGRRPGVRIRTNWKEQPPRQVWIQRVGPGWGSFAVVGHRLYTQEQWPEQGKEDREGKDEVVVCYDAATGAEVWSHRDSARFADLVSGPGPRATPTFHEGKLYALGAKGMLNCLDAATGKVIWTRDIVPDAEAKVPPWGFASSPLVVRDRVLVYTGSSKGKGMLAYKADTGEPAWAEGDAAHSYCSPQLARLAGVEQVLISSEAGLTAFDPAGGKVLWIYSWPTKDAARIIQPAVLGDTDVLIGSGFGVGTRRVHFTHANGSWGNDEVWTTRAISPYFNDLVVHKGHLYGFDNGFLTCVSLEDGTKRWRQRGYDNGQVLLLPDQDLLLVLSEHGVAALVEAKPEKHKELGRFQAVEGKTWNHPVVAHGKLFVRNAEFAACYDLAETK
jgi:outer membrane protein assembly factor BamB